MTITRVGTSQKYASGWENAFGGKKEPTKKKSATAIAKKPTAKAKAKSAPKKTSKQRTK